MSFLLPLHSRISLATAAVLVPAAERDNWRRLWHAELWHAQHHRTAHRLTGPRRTLRALDLTFGLLSDAAWLRIESLRIRFSGSPFVCIASLAAMCILAASFAFRLSGIDSRPLFVAWLSRQFWICFLPALIIASVGQRGLPRERRRQNGEDRQPLNRIYSRTLRASYLALKLVLVSAFVFLIGVDLFAPLPGLSRAVIPQLYLTAVMLAAAIRWASFDQQRRCLSCLHTLTTPTRVGRPSHNFLEWNGTASTCRHGHGALHQPELETSWQEAARWIIS